MFIPHNMLLVNPNSRYAITSSNQGLMWKRIDNCCADACRYDLDWYVNTITDVERHLIAICSLSLFSFQGIYPKYIGNVLFSCTSMQC